MAGYNGYSMSNNAVAAYEDGEKPLSKWTKADILDEIRRQEVELRCSVESLRCLPAKVLKGTCLTRSSWHHTSSYYNKTDFYSLDVDEIENLTDDTIKELAANYKKYKADEDTQSKPSEERWKCAFLEWTGSRKHPKATEVVEEGIVKGDWFYREDGSKKKTTANGFKFIEKIGG